MTPEADTRATWPAPRRADVVVYVASTPYDGPAGTDRHVADQLALRGPVVFVDPARSWRPRDLFRRRRPRRTGSSLVVVSPVVPPGTSHPVVHRAVAPVLRRAVRRGLATTCRGQDARTPVRGLITCSLEPVAHAVPARRTVHFATDDLVAGAELLGLPAARLTRNRAEVLATVDAVVAVSPPLADVLTGRGRPVVVVPNGCDPSLSESVAGATLPGDAPRARPVAGFVGHVNDRIDLALLEAVADAGTTLLIVGPVAHGRASGRFEALVSRPGVHWVGARPYGELPGYLAAMDVGLTPYRDSVFNRSSFPLKTLEYLAAGLPAVVTPLPAHDWLSTDLIDVAAGPQAFARRVAEVLARPASPAERARRRAFATQHSWAARADALLRVVDGDTRREGRP